MKKKITKAQKIEPDHRLKKLSKEKLSIHLREEIKKSLREV